MVTEASQISDLTNLSRVHEFGTRGREQNDGAGNILRSRSHIDWAVVHVETFGTASSDLADHQRIVKTRLELPRRLHGRNRKTPSAHCRRCNRNSSGPDHVNHHNCVAFTVKLNILRKTIDHDRFAHLFTFTIVGPSSTRSRRPQILLRKCVGMQAPAVNFHSQNLFQPYVTQVNLTAEMVEQRKLARFVGGLENDSTKSERIGKAIGVAAVEVPCPIKEPDLIRTLSGLHHKLKGTRVQPPLPLLH